MDLEGDVVVSLRDQATAYQSGTIGLQQLLEALTVPLLVLARKENAIVRSGSSPTDGIQSIVRIALLVGWFGGLERVVAGQIQLNSQKVPECKNFLALRKRTSVIKGILENGFVQVGQKSCTPDMNIVICTYPNSLGSEGEAS